MRINGYYFILMKLNTTEQVKRKQLKLVNKKHIQCYDKKKKRFGKHQRPCNVYFVDFSLLKTDVGVHRITYIYINKHIKYIKTILYRIIRDYIQSKFHTTFCFSESVKDAFIFFECKREKDSLNFGGMGPKTRQVMLNLCLTE